MKHIGIFEIDKNMCCNCREDEDCPQKYSVNGYCLSTESDLKREYIPETWEELVDLCKKLNSDRVYICERNENIQIGGSLMFTKEHTVEIDMDTIIHEYLPYSEMYPMIKSLARVYECK